MKYLLIANAYPSNGDIYKYVFVHQRVKYYLQAGIDVSVYRVDNNKGSAVIKTSYVYDGVRVLSGSVEDLEAELAASKFDTYLVHFPVPYILESLVRTVPDADVIVWLHGYETESWHRRWFDYLNSDSLSKISRVRENYLVHKLGFLKRLYSGTLINVRFVVVSKWFLKHRVEIDAGMTLVNPNIIPNYVDTHFFGATSKLEGQRLKILTIRPFSSEKYANDLMVKTIQRLRHHSLWDQLQFTICGDGPDFDEILKPLAGYKNVAIQKGFLSQEGIRDLHATHGIFLAPTRFDSQGVSTGEAMSSGLVPVSTNITAVPEYVEHGVSGLLGEPEDADSLAAAISELLQNPECFMRMSVEAAARVRMTLGAESTVIKEIELITDTSAGRGQDFGAIDWSGAYADLVMEMNNFVLNMQNRGHELRQ